MPWTCASASSSVSASSSGPSPGQVTTTPSVVMSRADVRTVTTGSDTIGPPTGAIAGKPGGAERLADQLRGSVSGDPSGLGNNNATVCRIPARWPPLTRPGPACPGPARPGAGQERMPIPRSPPGQSRQCPIIDNSTTARPPDARAASAGNDLALLVHDR